MKNGKKIRNSGGLMVLALVILYGCNATTETTPVAAPAKTQEPTAYPSIAINDVMVSFVDHAAHQLWNVEKEGGAPKNDSDWREIEHHATQLYAIGPLLMLGGTGQADPGWAQKPGWAKHTEELANAGLAASQAAQARNMEALIKANGQLVESCESCHKEFKPDLPSEGIVHGQ